MSFANVPSGKELPNDIYVVIEIPAESSPVKYEIDKDSDAVFVDRFMAAPMFYPANYGYINHTLADDGDALDVLVITPYPVVVGSVIRCRPVGILNMTDEAGEDAKLVAVPHQKLTQAYNDIHDIDDLPQLTKDRIAHFFENYKKLEKGKWVKVEGWSDAQAARDAIMQSVAAYEAAAKG
ncbi:inorganic diphosphatase [Nitrincola alkalilacustris]|uniref:inorganic diphosphatase n=1 Tax=Nitrincola alkalilacustris TaxID=1571224 RepID=UPI00124E8E4D|nr:inorganic diphosphatase [Nitrincola alkalilacustris]